MAAVPKFSDKGGRIGCRFVGLDLFDRKRPAGRAFKSMYGVDVEMLDAGDPFVSRIASA